MLFEFIYGFLHIVTNTSHDNDAYDHDATLEVPHTQNYVSLTSSTSLSSSFSGKPLQNTCVIVS